MISDVLCLTNSYYQFLNQIIQNLLKSNLAFYSGLFGVILFVIAAILGGLLLKDYNVLSQYISESYAIDTEHGKSLRFFGYLPSGILLTLFGILLFGLLPNNKLCKLGCIGFTLFYGIATVIVSLFPCDSGCNPELINPSISQIIHNITGGLTYLIMPICLILIGLGLNKRSNNKKIGMLSLLLGVLSGLLVIVLFSNQNSDLIGLYQRCVETIILAWVILIGSYFKKNRV